MNSIPFLKSKLIMPELSVSFLLTDRIKKLHRDMDSCRAVSVCAPAGYGKTSLAVSYFIHRAAATSRVCWYRLDPEDKNLSVFITHLSEAVFPSDSTEFAESRKSLSEHSDVQLQPYHTISVLCQEMWAQDSRNKHKHTYIVLDDFQNVAQVEDICDMTRYMFDNLPPSCTIFILTRANLNVFTEKQKLENNILEIDTSDLAFDNSEIRALMLSMGQTSPDKQLAEIIERNTEGWIAGIIILFQVIIGKGVDAKSIESGLLGNEDALFRYMSLEVFKSVDEDTRNSMIRLALLQDFSEAEASEILEIDDIQALMNHCLGFGMFIQRIPGNPVVYRFHSLFRKFLFNFLKNDCTREELSLLNLKAAEYYMSNGVYGRAAEHLAECGSSPSAMDIVIKAGFNKFMIGETGQLKIWLDLLPEEIIRANPILLLFNAQLMPNSKQLEMIDPLKKILFQALEANKLQIYYNVASVLIYIYNCTNDMKGLFEMAEGNPRQPGNVSPELACSLSMLDIVRFIAEERFSEAEAQSEGIRYTLLPKDSQWLYLILSCIVYYCLGKLDNGERCMRTALELFRFENIEPSRGFMLLFLSLILTLKNDREHLSSYLDDVTAIGEKYTYEYLSAHGKRLAAFDRYLSLERETSIELLDYAIFYFQQLSNKAMISACRLLKSLWTIDNHGQAPDSEDILKELNTIHKASPGLMVYEASLSIAGAIARESGDLSLAERNLLSSINMAKTKKGHQVLCGSYFHIARLYYVRGDREQGHKYLKQALETAAANSYFMFWDIHIPTLVEMALRGIRYGYCPDFAAELLSKFYNSTTVNYLIEKVKSIDENRIKYFVDDFVFTYKADKAKQLYLVKACLFGKPEISVNGVKIPDAEWKTKKVKGFLEYLLLESGNPVSKEYLADVFWPDSDSKSATASQRTALYSLRKALSKYNAEVTGNNAFIYETLEGLQIRRNDVLELDIHEFMDLYEELSLLKGDNPQIVQKQTEILKRMVNIYRGELMEGSDYGDLVIHERERLKGIFMEACQKLSSIYARQGELGRAEEILRRALGAEPYNENICLELLKLYMSQGRKSKAVKLYYSFKKRLEQELDINVDIRLTKAIKSP